MVKDLISKRTRKPRPQNMDKYSLYHISLERTCVREDLSVGSNVMNPILFLTLPPTLGSCRTHYLSVFGFVIQGLKLVDD